MKETGFYGYVLVLFPILIQNEWNSQQIFISKEINLCLKCIKDSWGLRIVLEDYSLETKKEFKNLKKQEIQYISTEIS